MHVLLLEFYVRNYFLYLKSPIQSVCSNQVSTYAWTYPCEYTDFISFETYFFCGEDVTWYVSYRFHLSNFQSSFVPILLL